MQLIRNYEGKAWLSHKTQRINVKDILSLPEANLPYISIITRMLSLLHFTIQKMKIFSIDFGMTIFIKIEFLATLGFDHAKFIQSVTVRPQHAKLGDNVFVIT